MRLKLLKLNRYTRKSFNIGSPGRFAKVRLKPFRVQPMQAQPVELRFTGPVRKGAIETENHHLNSEDLLAGSGSPGRFAKVRLKLVRYVRQTRPVESRHGSPGRFAKVRLKLFTTSSDFVSSAKSRVHRAGSQRCD